MFFFSRTPTVVLALVGLLATRHAVAAKPLLPVSAFFDNPSISQATIAPDGKHVAVIFNNSATKGRDQLGIIDLADNSIKVAAAYLELDIGRVDWINDHRLVFSLRDKATAPGKMRMGPGLYAVNTDGSARIQLIGHGGMAIVDSRAQRHRTFPAASMLVGPAGQQDSEAVYLARATVFNRDGTPYSVELYKVDTLTLVAESVEGPAKNTREWTLDARGRPALVTTAEDNLETLHYLDPKAGDPKTGGWRKLLTKDIYLGTKGSIEPLGFTPQGEMLVLSRRNGDTTAPFVYDLAAGKLTPQPMVETPGFDFMGWAIVDDRKLLGLRYIADTEGTVWFDSATKQVQEAVDKLLPGRVNSIDVGRRADAAYVLVSSFSDLQPQQFFVFNRQTAKLTKLGDTHPDIVAKRMAGMDFQRLKARDGETIPTWITVPDGKRKNLPMVVLVHGGPYVRGADWRWGAERQFLASRGYVVLEPEFRGSMGYGEHHFRAGWKQWGLAMQNDIADATRWAIAEGIADPKRICIAGASYGGYATLMGLIRDPDLYKCGVDWVGVTDIDLLYSGGFLQVDSLVPDSWKRHGMPNLIGDREKDAAQFAATSPLKQAARIRQPLLLAYGRSDGLIPIFHGRRFADAVKANNKQVEWVEYEDEGHGWKLLETRLDFWGRVEKFLQQQIGDTE